MDDITILYHEGYINSFDLHFARFVGDLAETGDPDVLLGAALVSHVTGSGDVCLDLENWAGKTLLEKNGDHDKVVCPPLHVWRKKLSECGVVGQPPEYCPLIRNDGNRLYLYRYWQYESGLAASIIQRVNFPRDTVDFARLANILDRFFPGVSQDRLDRQKLAAAVAAMGGFCVISGGPGTGKTTTAGKILGVLQEQAFPKKLKIFLCAPTGKAAVRLADSMKQVKARLPCDESIKNAIPVDAFTIHRMLQTIPETPYFRHNAENPLDADVIVVDEASMVDIALMFKLLQAVPAEARIILMGDKDQLASVEAGAVLGDICDRDTIHPYSMTFCRQIENVMGKSPGPAHQPVPVQPGVQDHIVQLIKSYRFPENSTVATFSRAVNSGRAHDALAIVRNNPEAAVRWKTIASVHDLMPSLTKTALDAYAPYLDTDDPIQALQRFNRFRILCAVKAGPFGVTAVNRFVEQVLVRHGLIRTDFPPGSTSGDPWYRGRPVLITRNDYHLGLFNGDIGMTLADPDAGGKLQVYFPVESGEIRRFSPHRLPEHETAYAMTVHKSQGSEFENVILVLPDRDVPVLTRELVYTAVTRARKTVTIWGTETVFSIAVKRRIQRTSGLRDALWPAGDPP